MLPRPSAARAIALAFAALIAAGAGLLKLPAANNGLSWEDALFLSVSAVTVTSLQSVDPATALTPLGQALLAGLVQVGGLGIMTVTTVAALLVGYRLGFRELLLLREELASPEAPRNVLRLAGQVALITALVELSGFLVLAGRFLLLGYGPAEALGYATFNAIAAFCNAGFNVFEEGLSPFAGDWAVNLALVYLIVAGGLGFPVLANLYRYRRMRRLTLQSRLVLTTSALLVAAGALSVALLEWDNPQTLGGRPLHTRLLMSLLQGVTPRTAGYATVDYAEMRDPTLAIQTALMFVGTGPVSTGGGIKVTTLALLFLIVLAQVRGREEVSAFGRTVGRTVISRSLALLSLAALLVGGSSVALMILEGVPFLPAVFEVTSAFGTVGLSLGPPPGLSSELGWSGKLLLELVMFAGRLGPVTVALAFSERSRPRRYGYPEEDIAIG